MIFQHNGGNFSHAEVFGPTVETLQTGSVRIEQKTFLFELQENARGRYLRITEQNKGRRNSIVIPAPGLSEFHDLLASVLRNSDVPKFKT
jgi:hypothetical protein